MNVNYIIVIAESFKMSLSAVRHYSLVERFRILRGTPLVNPNTVSQTLPWRGYAPVYNKYKIVGGENDSYFTG
jgi:hypothetical protein